MQKERKKDRKAFSYELIGRPKTLYISIMINARTSLIVMINFIVVEARQPYI